MMETFIAALCIIGLFCILRGPDIKAKHVEDERRIEKKRMWS
jgi:hypothetical protein